MAADGQIIGAIGMAVINDGGGHELDIARKSDEEQDDGDMDIGKSG